MTLPSAFAIAVTLSACGPRTPSPSVAGDVRLESFMTQQAGFSGSVLVMREGHVVVDRGYGLADREGTIANTPATVHAIGSITKQFTAAAILKLQEEGKLAVTDLLGKYLEVPPDKAGITLHHLLTHSAGLPDAFGDDYEVLDRDAFVARVMKTPLLFAPGSRFEYSNVGYSVLAAIVELRSGGSYEAYLREHLLVPAGLMQTGYRMPPWQTLPLAIGYRKDGQRWGTMIEQPWATDGPYWNLRGNGGLLSTTHDLARWVTALHDHRVLSAATVRAMWSPQIAEGPAAKSHYGYGWAIFRTPRGTRLITHNGGNGVQFADVLFYVDEGVIVVVMSNASIRGQNDLAWHIGRMQFDPTYVPPAPVNTAMKPSLPAGPAGARMQALLDIIVNDQPLEPFLRANLGPGFLTDLPIERHIAVFEQVRREIGAHTLVGVAQTSAEEYVLHLKSTAKGGLFKIVVQLRPSDSLISGLGIERN